MNILLVSDDHDYGPPTISSKAGKVPGQLPEAEYCRSHAMISLAMALLSSLAQSVLGGGSMPVLAAGSLLVAPDSSIRPRAIAMRVILPLVIHPSSHLALAWVRG